MRRVLLLVLIAVLAGVSGCGGTSSPEAAPSNFESLLRLAPDNAESRKSLYLFDYERVRSLLGISPPSDMADATAIDDYRTALVQGMVGRSDLRPIGSDSVINGLSVYGRELIRPETVGYSVVNVDGELNAQGRMGSQSAAYEAVIGRFDPGATNAALESCSSCPQPQVVDYGGSRYYAWGADFEQDASKRIKPPVFDALGRGGRWFFTEEFVLRTVWTQGIEEMIDASQGRGSLADDKDIKGMARELASMGAYAAFFSTETQGPDMRNSVLGLTGLPASEQRELQSLWDLSGQVLVHRYESFALGQSVDEKGPFLVVLLQHGSEKAARENAALLKQRIESAASTGGRRWADVVTRVESKAEGRLVIARLYGYKGFTDFLNQGDPLLLHE